ncbi:hypothetical protein QWZ03_06245 [Chitinimonas viridis]|uniref:Uncharacterized protein n=1 Tax=Chitinimonas viridis TaxID=664880 RepID=A0ABT8B2X9_9NEIS|nr:hypothetical protein [Chitinimonas viridis]MDN3576364.1 hypothetical protein [Chitinimonas viridis]
MWPGELNSPLALGLSPRGGILYLGVLASLGEEWLTSGQRC